MNIPDIDILRIIPQLPPFVMVDKLLSVSENSAATEFLIDKDVVFVEAGKMNAAGIVENIAQTCAAGLGYMNVVLAKNNVMIGFLAAIRDMVFHRLPEVGEKLTTKITILENVYSMTIVEGEVYIEEEQIARGSMKIFITNMEDVERRG